MIREARLYCDGKWDAGDEGVAEEFWGRLAAKEYRFLTNRDPHVKLGRWLSWLDSAWLLLSTWSARQLIYSVACVKLGLVSPKDGKILAKFTECLTATEKPIPSETRDPGLRAGDPSVSKARRQCKNTLHLSMLFLCEPSFRTRISRTLVLCNSYRKNFGQIRKELRGPESALAFAIAQARGKQLASLNELVACLFSADKLEQMCFALLHPGDGPEHPVRTESLQLEERLSAHECGALAVSLLKVRVQTQCQYFMGWPQQLAMLAHLAPVEVRKAGVLLLRRGCEAFAHVATHGMSKSADIRKRVQRSPFMQPVVRSMVAHAMRDSWEWTDALGERAAALFRGFGNSGLCEDVAQKCRTEEPDNGVMTPLMCTQSL